MTGIMILFTLFLESDHKQVLLLLIGEFFESPIYKNQYFM